MHFLTCGFTSSADFLFALRRPDPVILFPVLILFPVSDLTPPLFSPLVSPRSACTLGPTPSPAVPVTTPSTSPRGCWDSTRTTSRSSTRCPNSVSHPKAFPLTRPRKWGETTSCSRVDSVYLILSLAVFSSRVRLPLWVFRVVFISGWC